MGLDRRYVIWALAYAAIGMGLGIYMAASHNHAEFITHAHILLVGFVVSLIYSVIHRLWLAGGTPRTASVQFVVHQAGAILMFIGLALMYGGLVPAADLDPILAVASIAVLVGALMMIFMVVKANIAAAPPAIRADLRDSA